MQRRDAETLSLHKVLVDCPTLRMLWPWFNLIGFKKVARLLKDCISTRLSNMIGELLKLIIISIVEAREVKLECTIDADQGEVVGKRIKIFLSVSVVVVIQNLSGREHRAWEKRS